MSKPIEIVAVKRQSKQPEPQVQKAPENVTKNHIMKKAGQSDPEKQKRKLPSSGSRIKTDAPAVSYQAIGIFSGHLNLNDEKLTFQCNDGITFPICGIDGKLALWLLAHPAEAFSTEQSDWVIYPKAHLKTGELTVYLKGRRHERSTIELESDTAQIKGKLLSVDGDKMTIGIRRNLSMSVFKELVSKGMIRGTEFDQFTVPVLGTAPAEPGQVVELTCKRVGCQLIALDTISE